MIEMRWVVVKKQINASVFMLPAKNGWVMLQFREGPDQPWRNIPVVEYK